MKFIIGIIALLTVYTFVLGIIRPYDESKLLHSIGLALATKGEEWRKTFSSAAIVNSIFFIVVFSMVYQQIDETYPWATFMLLTLILMEIILAFKRFAIASDSTSVSSFIESYKQLETHKIVKMLNVAELLVLILFTILMVFF